MVMGKTGSEEKGRGRVQGSGGSDEGMNGRTDEGKSWEGLRIWGKGL